DAFAEERAGTLRGPVDKLIGHDNVAGRNLFAQAAHRAHRDDPLDAEFFHSKDVGAGIHFGAQPTMAFAVAGQKEEFHSIQDASDEFIRRLAERGLDLYLADIFQPRHLVQTASADDADDRSSHLPLTRLGCKQRLNLGVPKLFAL